MDGFGLLLQQQLLQSPGWLFDQRVATTPSLLAGQPAGKLFLLVPSCGASCFTARTPLSIRLLGLCDLSGVKQDSFSPCSPHPSVLCYLLLHLYRKSLALEMCPKLPFSGFLEIFLLRCSSFFPRVGPWVLLHFTGLFKSLLGVVDREKHRLLLNSCITTHSLGFAYSPSAI